MKIEGRPRVLIHGTAEVPCCVPAARDMKNSKAGGLDVELLGQPWMYSLNLMTNYILYR